MTSDQKMMAPHPINDQVYMCEVFGVNGGPIGMADTITYDVRVVGATNSIVAHDVTPAGRRPSSTSDIVAAEIGDIGFIKVRAGKMYLQIAEGLHVVDCSEVTA